jgi:hypothetical protein
MQINKDANYMKAKKFLILLIIPLLLGFASENKSPLSGDTPVALVKKIVKDVFYKKTAEQTDWERAKTGLPLKDGEQVKTDSKSLALILFTDGSGLLRVRENSIVNVYGTANNKRMDKNTVINRGEVQFEVNKQQDEEFKFTTPTAVASIRGTEGLFNVADNGDSKMILENGNVELTTKTGKKVTLTAGNTAVFDQSGEAKIYSSTQADKEQLSKAKSLNTKKVKINTNSGEVEIEYFSDQK